MGFNIKLIAERLGHENIQTTLETYGHLYPNKHAQVAEKLDNLENRYQNVTSEQKKAPETAL